MPEAFEIRAQLVPRIPGRTHAPVEALDTQSKRLCDPLEVTEEFEGEGIVGTRRRESYLVLHFESQPTLCLAEPLVARRRPVVLVAENSS